MSWFDFAIVSISVLIVIFGGIIAWGLAQRVGFRRLFGVLPKGDREIVKKVISLSLRQTSELLAEYEGKITDKRKEIYSTDQLSDLRSIQKELSALYETREQLRKIKAYKERTARRCGFGQTVKDGASFIYNPYE